MPWAGYGHEGDVQARTSSSSRRSISGSCGPALGVPGFSLPRLFRDGMTNQLPPGVGSHAVRVHDQSAVARYAPSCPFRIPAMSAVHAARLTISNAPSGSLEARTATIEGKLVATSTQLPCVPLWLLLRQIAPSSESAGQPGVGSFRL